MSHGWSTSRSVALTARPPNALHKFIPSGRTSGPPQKCVLRSSTASGRLFQQGPWIQATRGHLSSAGSTNPRTYRTLRKGYPHLVALEHVEWRIIDAAGKRRTPPRRRERARRPGPLGTDGFDVRKPQHLASWRAIRRRVLRPGFDFDRLRGVRCRPGSIDNGSIVYRWGDMIAGSCSDDPTVEEGM